MVDPGGEDPNSEDDYRESEDEDYNPDAAATNTSAAAGGAAGDGSSDEDESDDLDGHAKRATARSKHTGRRRRRSEADAEDAGFENSGDEAIVSKGIKRKRRQGASGSGGDAGDEDSGGEGGFIKTRSMRATAAEEQARRPIASTAGATIDVEATWAAMNMPGASYPSPAPPNGEKPVPEADSSSLKISDQGTTTSAGGVEEADLIEIEETIKFAGEVEKRKKLVARDSDEGQAWLKAQEQAAQEAEAARVALLAKAKKHPDTGEPLLRPLRRVSLWDPNPEGIVKGLPTNVLSETNAGNKLRVVDKSKLGWHTDTEQQRAFTKGDKAKVKATKLNVVEKSKLDWQAHVDAAGDKDELEAAARAKGSYLERRDFLERVEARKEHEERRMKTT